MQFTRYCKLPYFTSRCVPVAIYTLEISSFSTRGEDGMRIGSERAEEGDGLSAALRRFPELSLQIKERLMRDESFRGMCEDLAAAEYALACADQLPPHIREERRDEFRGLIESLAAEIEQALG